MFGAAPGNLGPAAAKPPAVFTDPRQLSDAARRQREYANKQRYLQIPQNQRQEMERNAAQIRADFAPEPQQPAQQPMHQPFLRGLMDHDRAPRRPQDWRAAMYEQGTEAMNRAVDQTNAVIGKEMDRRARTADDERDRAHEMAMAQMEQESEARRDAAMLQQDQERRAFLGNLLASAGVIPRQVRFGG